MPNYLSSVGLYDPKFEHDACGVGFVANIHGRKSHKNVVDALTVLENMEHRGASGFEYNTGDGAGIMIQKPHEFFFDECLKLGIHLPAYDKYGVGVLFFPKQLREREECREIFARIAEELGLEIIGYRKVPVNTDGIGSIALSVEPEMEHVFIACPDHITNVADFERKLFVLKNYATHLIRNTVKQGNVEFYVASLSTNTIIYKGQLTSHQVRSYFTDLSNKKLVSAFGLVHSRFATNTFPSWALAQPFRYLAHNGEINTLQGNLNWLTSSEKNFVTPYFTKQEMDMILPLVSSGQSDSACLDNMVEMLHLCGRPLPEVMMMLVPEAWDGNKKMDPLLKSFYEYHATLTEPWDGPASLSFTNGNVIGATLDRNGLRPARYCVTKDDRVILASEMGTLPIDPSEIIFSNKLEPGKMFIIDMEKGEFIGNDDIKKEIASKYAYAEWLNEYKIRIEDLPEPRVMFTHLRHNEIVQFQKVFGYTEEDLNILLKPMAIDGKEPLGAMGIDTPLAVLSDQPQHLSYYFKQLFAQVTNPPIDPIRENLVMSLKTFVGNNGNILSKDPKSCHTVVLQQPILTNKQLEKLRSIDTGSFQAKTLQTYFRANGEAGSLKAGLDRLCRYAADAVNDGFEVIVLSDRCIDSEHAAIPSLLAVSAVHHHLIRKGLRSKVGLVVEAGDIWETHHFACLLGFGATAINPYLAFSSIRLMKETRRIDSELNTEQLFSNYIHAIDKGLFKIFSKMGISTLQSYHGAQIFEIIGISKLVVERYFSGATSRIQGIGLDEIAKEVLLKHYFGYNQKLDQTDLSLGGVYQWRRKGETHLFNPKTIHLLQKSTQLNDYQIFKQYSKAVNDQSEKAVTLRSLLELIPQRTPIALDEVESAENIYPRFATGAMSFGSISWEAHTTLAIAMNRLGGKSNTGEGGEDERRFSVMDNGDNMRSSIKQVASGRFGVTSYYLTEADELQIKMAQGAKPGEGGQLPGFKVDKWIAKTRHSTPGVGLISPPPHHDIYSIEDLAQLIYDLKNANRAARISVKLVSKAGVGTIAAGVAKAKSDVILISGYDGGTGASPISSIRHAGLPWELGLAETHQTLVLNRLRNRVTLQADGQIKTGRDIAIATLLGAEEWGVATAALVVEGCILTRKCNLNTCPVGIATQDEELRKRYTGAADHVVNFIKFLTEELREIMASLGYRTINEMVGQVENLKLRDNISHWKYKHLDLSPILMKVEGVENDKMYHTEYQDHALDNILDWKLMEVARPVLNGSLSKAEAEFEINNTNRTVGTLLSNEITKLYQDSGLPTDSLRFKFKGTAGQSFGAFSAKGLTLELEGAGNDYFGKGLSGAKVIVYPDKSATFKAEANIIIGNTAFYGATSGEAYVRGMAGERFAVRNSGASIVVEGVGAHGCEYMTGGTVVIIGRVGLNFGAGMSGGIAYVYDVNNTFKDHYNPEMIELDHLDDNDLPLLKKLLEKHTSHTDSAVSSFILADWENQISNFVKVFPTEYKKALLANNQIHSAEI